ncbi:hypothetical protein [Streptomyces anulatus]|uniref:hypothetical protein n=1 Tax=Streptomyces anulatus TaxID=1892 RepID=UPI0038698892|nr:hypothetical protein OG536_02285 [Streptomyces anulatus]
MTTILSSSSITVVTTEERQHHHRALESRPGCGTAIIVPVGTRTPNRRRHLVCRGLARCCLYRRSATQLPPAAHPFPRPGPGPGPGTRLLGSLLTARGKRDDHTELPGRVLPVPGEPGRPS